MDIISRILVPLDIHHLSEAKIPFAEAQARAFEAELILLHVYPPDHVLADAVSSAEAQARTYLDAIVARLHTDGLSARSLVRAGRPAETILAEITAQSANLVVLGSSIRHGLSRLLLGSVAEEIVARAPCPVLLVRPPTSSIERPPAVRSFAEDATRTGPLSQRDLGMRTVEVARIIGSVGRSADLDENFHSRHPQRVETQRAKRILSLMSEGASLPAIVLYKLGYGYYVLDGHHRVAAAKELGQLEVEAHVTEYIPLGDPQVLQVSAERRAFERATGLRRIGAALPGTYPRLEEMIRAFAQHHDLPDLHDAAQRWEQSIYRPRATQIRRRRLTLQFPGERTADVFVRLTGDGTEQEAHEHDSP